MKKITLFAVLINVLFNLLFSCKGKENGKDVDKNSSEVTGVSAEKKQLNITILMDLSDRISPEKYPAEPSHMERDLSIVNYFVEVFKKDMEKKGAFKMKGKIKVIFSPLPQISGINNIASNLNVNTSSMKPEEKKLIYDSIQNVFENNLKAVYGDVINSHQYVGADIWRFFKNDVKDLAIDNDEAYRNILVILTDGYLYHQDSKMIEAGKYSYITPQQLRQLGIDGADWETKMKDKGFGLINPRHEKDLRNLEVLVLEVNPADKTYQENILNKVLSNWFDEMGVGNYKIYQTDVFSSTEPKIKNFLNN